MPVLSPWPRLLRPLGLILLLSALVVGSSARGPLPDGSGAPPPLTPSPPPGGPGETPAPPATQPPPGPTATPVALVPYTPAPESGDQILTMISGVDDPPTLDPALAG